MPLTALALESRLLREISPEDSDRFYEILAEADQRLLEAGKWQWTRRPLDLTPVDGIVTLPEGYESIVGCRVGSMAAGVLWQEIEYLEGGPGVIPVEGLNGQLLDLGLLESEYQLWGDVSVTGITDSGSPVVVPTLSYGGQEADLPCWTNNGEGVSHSGVRHRLYYDDADGDWILEDLLANWKFAATSTADSPVDLTWELVSGSFSLGGLPVIDLEIPVNSRLRRYRCTGSQPEAIVVLARFSPIAEMTMQSVPRCQSFSALKLAMQAVVAEDVNNLERANLLFAMATGVLDNQESSYRGSAKKIFDPQIYGPPRRRTSRNFP